MSPGCEGFRAASEEKCEIEISVYGRRCPAGGCDAPPRECSGDKVSSGGVKTCVSDEIYYKTAFTSDDHVSNTPIHLTPADTSDDEAEVAEFDAIFMSTTQAQAVEWE